MVNSTAFSLTYAKMILHSALFSFFYLLYSQQAVHYSSESGTHIQGLDAEVGAQHSCCFHPKCPSSRSPWGRGSTDVGSPKYTPTPTGSLYGRQKVTWLRRITDDGSHIYKLYSKIQIVL